MRLKAKFHLLSVLTHLGWPYRARVEQRRNVAEPTECPVMG